MLVQLNAAICSLCPSSDIPLHRTGPKEHTNTHMFDLHVTLTLSLLNSYAVFMRVVMPAHYPEAPWPHGLQLSLESASTLIIDPLTDNQMHAVFPGATTGSCGPHKPRTSVMRVFHHQHISPHLSIYLLFLTPSSHPLPCFFFFSVDF